MQEWEFDSANVPHLGRHGITPDMVLQVAASRPRFVPTFPRAGRSSSHRMIGQTMDGRCWTIPITRVEDSPETWRAITGWPSTRREERHYREQTQA